MNSKVTNKQRNAIEEALLCYTCDKFTEMTMQKLGVVRATYAIISQALHDLYNGTVEQQADALQWFKSANYTRACLAVQIDQELMDRIIYSPDEFVDNITYGDEELDLVDEDESFTRF